MLRCCRHSQIALKTETGILKFSVYLTLVEVHQIV
jgi:hypothetical protein